MWEKILDEQRGPSPPRLSVEDATELYENADFNLLRSVALERRKIVNPGNHVTYMIDRNVCLLYTSPSPRDVEESRMPSSA